MKKVKLLKDVMIEGQPKKAGSVIELEPGLASRLVNGGKAEEPKAKGDDKKKEDK